MKKIIFALSAMAISAAVMTACGNDTGILVEHNENAYHVMETEPVTTKAKVKEIRRETAAADDKSAESSKTTAKAADEGDEKEVSATKAAETSENPETPATPEIPENTQPAQGNSGDTSADTPTEEQEEYFLEGVVYRKSAQNILIKEKDLSLLSIGFKDKSVIDSIGLGDEVRVSYDGIIMESYPGQVHKANGAEVVSKAVYEGKIKHFICEASELPQSFTVLLPDGWTIKEIDYPKDGEFTDWGYRIVPKGENNGLDISWHSSFSIRERYDIFPDTFNGCPVKKYGSDGEWRFYTYDNGYIAANNFYKTDKYEEYKDEFEFILNTLIFGQTEFIGD